jgi:hypothetical protein
MQEWCRAQPKEWKRYLLLSLPQPLMCENLY